MQSRKTNNQDQNVAVRGVFPLEGTVHTSSLTAAVAGSCQEEALGLGSLKGVLRNPAAPQLCRALAEMAH